MKISTKTSVIFFTLAIIFIAALLLLLNAENTEKDGKKNEKNESAFSKNSDERDQEAASVVETENSTGAAVKISFTGILEKIDLESGSLTVAAPEKTYNVSLTENTVIFKDNLQVKSASLIEGDLISVIGRGETESSTDIKADSIYATEIDNEPFNEPFLVL
ncbi:MAG TPA: hypothetical protein P5080_00305 [Candidatus Paceibacterota bacterium]|nr:hypothetical protein [Candidatus Pacearchaeota archaeon]HRZ50416.1 hypothetical protein [Candidatus Paceibacterota bacterium]HSA36137.1 hypothetical protein [Candidatus Paceibacterota bacterium]